jgi:uncharacterized damage-inducible protein DinB
METIQNMFKHVHWANLRILDTLHDCDEENKQTKNLFSHILHAENVWLTRLKGADSSHLPIWGEVSLDTCKELVIQNNRNFTDFLSNLTKSEFDQILTYKNSSGTEFQSSIRDILTHVALHGQYHRGQINQLLRAAELEPVNVDYITFSR